MNKYIETNKRNLLSRLGDWGEWQKIQSSQNSGKHEIKVLKLSFKKNGTESWTQYQPGIYEPITLLIQEHDSFNHQW